MGEIRELAEKIENLESTLISPEFIENAPIGEGLEALEEYLELSLNQEVRSAIYKARRAQVPEATPDQAKKLIDGLISTEASIKGDILNMYASNRFSSERVKSQSGNTEAAHLDDWRTGMRQIIDHIGLGSERITLDQLFEKAGAVEDRTNPRLTTIEGVITKKD